MIETMEPYDVAYVVRCLQDMRKEIAACAEVEDNYDYVFENLLAMQASDSFIGLIGGERQGFIIGIVTPTWYDQRIKAYEQLLYVAPEYRKSSLGSRLITKFCKVAKDRGAVEVIAGTSLGFKTNAVAALYKRKGFAYFGESFKLKIE